MAIRSIAHLKSYFQALPWNDRPSAQDFTDLFDTLQFYEDVITSSHSANNPVLLVADQAARLAAGPSLVVSKRVKQIDNGETYVKQQATGANAGDWISIGDVEIEIADVNGLQTALAGKLINDDDDQNVARLGVFNTRNHTVGAWSFEAGSPNVVSVDPQGSGINYVEVAADFSLAISSSLPEDDAGRTVSGVIYNSGGGDVVVSLTDIDETAGMFGIHPEWPVTIPAGKYLWVQLNFITRPGPIPAVLVRGYLEATEPAPSCPVPAPPAFTLPADYSSRYSIASRAAAQLAADADWLAIPTSNVSGDGIHILDVTVNPMTVLYNHTWPGGATPKYPQAMYYDPDGGVIVALMSLQAANHAIGFFDPVTGYISHESLTYGGSFSTSDVAIIPIRGYTGRVFVKSPLEFHIVDTVNKTILTTWPKFTRAFGRPTWVCPAGLGCSYRSHEFSRSYMFDITTGALNGVMLGAGGYFPTYIDSIGQIACLHGSSTITLKTYDPVTGNLVTSVAALPDPYEYYVVGSASMIYNFALDRLVIFVFDNDTSKTHLVWYDPSDWSYEITSMDDSEIFFAPETIAAAANGRVYTKIENTFHAVIPII